MTDAIQNGEAGSSVRAKLNENFVDVSALKAASALSFDTVAGLLADSTLTYVTAPAGTIVEAGGFRYAVAASAATDHHVTTAGGVKLYVLADAEGWRPLQAFGTAGDGVANDTAVVQLAINVSPYLKGQPGAIYKCTAAVTIPSNITIDMNGARIRRGFAGGPFVLRSTNSWTTWDNEEIHLKNIWIDDDGTTATRGGGLNIAGNRITVDGYRYTCTAPYDGTNGANAIYVTGKNITFRRIWINSRAQGTYADGVHAAYLENFTMTDFHIETQDDAIALHPDTAAFPWTGQNLASKNIDIQGGYVSSLDSNGIRIGAWGVATIGTITPKPNVVWQNVNIDMAIGQCGTSCIEMVDTRNTSEIASGAKNTDISIRARVQSQDNPVRIINLVGNPDISNVANVAQRNYGRVRIDVEASADDTTSANLVYAGGFDYLKISGSLRYFDTVAPALTHMQFFGGGDLLLDGLTTSGQTTGTVANFKWIENVIISDIEHLADGNLEFQTFVLTQTPEVEMSFFLRGGRIAETARAINLTGTGKLKNFVVEGTTLGSTNAFPLSGTFTNTTWASGAQVVFNPSGGYFSTVANLLGSGVPVVEGHRAFATNGRKSGEGAAAGTGQPVYRDGTDWRVFRDDSVVLA